MADAFHSEKFDRVPNLPGSADFARVDQPVETLLGGIVIGAAKLSGAHVLFDEPTGKLPRNEGVISRSSQVGRDPFERFYEFSKVAVRVTASRLCFAYRGALARSQLAYRGRFDGPFEVQMQFRLWPREEFCGETWLGHPFPVNAAARRAGRH